MWLMLPFVINLTGICFSFITDELLEFDPKAIHQVKVSINIPSVDNFTTDLTKRMDLVRLRQHVSIIDTFNSDEFIYLKINHNNSVALVQSPLLASPNFFTQTNSENIELSLNNTADSRYHPMCVYHTIDDVVDGVLDLCSGVKGYLEHGSYITFIKPMLQDFSEDVHHVVTTKRSTGQGHEGHEGEDESSTNEFKKNLYNVIRRQRRKREAFKRRYLEVYVICDFDFYRLRCGLSRARCIRKMFQVMRPVSLLYKKTFNLIIVISGMDIWTDEETNKRNGVPTYKDHTVITKNKTEAFMLQLTSLGNTRKIAQVAACDVILLVTKSKPILAYLYSVLYGLANRGGACQSAWAFAFSDHLTDNQFLITIAHEIGHTLGADHVTTRGCSCGRIDCIMHLYSKGIFSNEGVFSKCTIATITQSIKHHRSKWCLNNYPAYTESFKRCGNLILDTDHQNKIYDEECELTTGNLCCDINCRKVKAAQCGWGDCCDLNRCALKSAGVKCSLLDQGLDCNNTCSGDSGLCPRERNTCDDNYDDCKNNKCAFTGDCVDGLKTYTCKCYPGYEGKLCDKNIDDCYPDACAHGACVDKLLSYICTCEAGYKGKRCDIDIDDCTPNPCGPHGTCEDRIGNYFCNCHSGYFGTQCHNNIDDCKPESCQHGTCTDGVNSFTCSCQAGYIGDACDIYVDDWYADWTMWAPCTCIGASDKQTRNRECSPIPKNEGKPCPGESLEMRECEHVPGCINGQWGAWHEWGPCKCLEDKLKHRERLCDNPPPSNGGEGCTGIKPQETGECSMTDCKGAITPPPPVIRQNSTIRKSSQSPEISAETTANAEVTGKALGMLSTPLVIAIAGGALFILGVCIIAFTRALGRQTHKSKRKLAKVKQVGATATNRKSRHRSRSATHSFGRLERASFVGRPVAPPITLTGGRMSSFGGLPISSSGHNHSGDKRGSRKKTSKDSKSRKTSKSRSKSKSAANSRK